jgi:hypothetical protein
LEADVDHLGVLFAAGCCEGPLGGQDLACCGLCGVQIGPAGLFLATLRLG